MKTLKKVEVKYCFVEYIPLPKDMEQGMIYISKEYGVANHLCLCGCGNQTPMPINKTYGWEFTEENEKITFTPSIGNFQLPCKSHYIITKNIANFV